MVNQVIMMKNTKTKFNSDDNLPLNEILKLYNLTIVAKKSTIYKFF